MNINNIEGYYSIKKAIFVLVAQKTMVRYDIEGKKRHFMEPESLRKLNDFWILRQSMDDLPNERDKNFLEILDFNYRRSMDDLLFRYAEEYLTHREAKFFLELSETDIRRRGEVIVIDFLHKISKISKKEMYFTVLDEGEYHHIFEKDYSIFKYSYGELMRVFYFLGREDIYDKNLVRALLAMYTLVLTKIFYRCKLGKDSQCKNNYEILKTLISGSVSGSWSRYIFPELDLTTYLRTEQNERYFSGCSKDISLIRKYLLLSKKAYDLINTLPESIAQKKSKKSSAKNQEENNFLINKLEETTSKLCNEMYRQFVLLIFLTVKRKYSFRIPASESEKLKSSVTQNAAELMLTKPDTNFVIEFTKGQVDYNILNFINNTFIYEEILKEFVNAIWNMIKDKTKEFLPKKDQYILSRVSIERIIAELENTENGFYSDMKHWKTKSGGAVVPFYSTDIFYNMLKRMTRKQTLHSKDTISPKELYYSMCKSLKYIETCLDANDQWYSDNKNYRFIEKLGDIFRETLDRVFFQRMSCN